MRCRGQVTPESRQLTYEVFVTEVSAGPEPTLFADVLCTVDGVKAFHARRVGLRLVPDWPMSRWRHLAAPAQQRTGELVPVHTLGGLRGHVEPRPVAEVDGFRFDYASLLACAWGRPSEAFGPMYTPFDGTRRVARLPGPPYHFMSRIAAVSGPLGGMQTGSWVEAEYDVPDDVWYREQNGSPAMPLSVLMEVVLQPCGWLASFVGSALTTDIDLMFRNLDGDGVVTGEILPGTRVLRTRAEITKIAQTAGMIIESFEVECFADDRPVYRMSTVFGYFPKEAFDNQVGLPPSDEERAQLAEPCARSVDLTTRPDRYCSGSLRLAGPMLLMLDRVTGYWPDGGRAGLGRLRSEKDVDPSEWFFKAHFFQDPVQPGSLGVEAMAQLLQFYLIERDMGAGLRRPRFESVMTDHRLHWKYRGQVVPRNKLITVEVEILEVGEDERGRYAVAEGWLWADDKRIYHAPQLAMRVVSGDDATGVPDLAAGSWQEHPVPAVDVLDPTVDTWLTDHCPTWTVPALPMMSVADRLASAAAAATGQAPVALRDVQLHRWIRAHEPVRLSYEVTGSGRERTATLLAWRDAANPALSRFEPVATATVLVGAAPERPAALEPLPDAQPVPDPYESGALFHGPSFQYLTSLRIGAGGSSGTLDADRGAVPRGAIHQGLLDAATHAIPHGELHLWSAEIDTGLVGYPHRIAALDIHEALPDTGEVRVEARFAGFDGDGRSHPVFDVQLSRADRVLASIRLVEVLLPKGPLGSAPPADRRAFLRDRCYAGGLGLSTTERGVTRLAAEAVDQSDWLVGTIAHTYALPAGVGGRDRLAEIAVRDHVARELRLHPSEIAVSPDLRSAHPTTQAGDVHRVVVKQDGDGVVVSTP
jgi:3-hydroxymyristoyl/3-hydroxydecanoyl-(acyl carrier protein) dehydratase